MPWAKAAGHVSGLSPWEWRWRRQPLRPFEPVRASDTLPEVHVGAFKRISDQARFELWRLRDSLRDRLQGRGHRQKVFARIYSQNLWVMRSPSRGPDLR